MIENSIVFTFRESKPPSEGGRCPACGEDGALSYKVGDCSCHIMPPCPACTDARLKCVACGEEFNS
jgi:hypothetical protein